MNLSEDIFVCLAVLLDRLRLCYSRQRQQLGKENISILALGPDFACQT